LRPFDEVQLWYAKNYTLSMERDPFSAKYQTPGMSTDRTEANFGRIRTGSHCNFFENWL